jgi:PucR C-terminal helix-turn-helix domain/GGDEF-like domain
MQRLRGFESDRQPAPDRGADSTAPRSTPLTLVAGAVAGDDLVSVAGAASAALGHAVVIAIPALGEPVVSPPGALPDDDLRAVREHATAIVRGDAGTAPSLIHESVAVRIGQDILGIVVATAELPEQDPEPERRAWLEATAAAAAVAALMRGTLEVSLEGSRTALLREFGSGAPDDVANLVARARRLGFELGAGAVAVCAQCPPANQPLSLAELATGHAAMLAEVGDGRVLGLVPLESASSGTGAAERFADTLVDRGMTVALSAPRRDPATLHDALREAELLIELTALPDAPLAGQEETYRLLIGVLLRDPAELELLRTRTISELADYDAQHDTELLVTLQAFLTHHGSTTETAEAMHLHRHTVGYRLSRVHEVSGLSPYESDGRERLSLGLKAQQILDAESRRAQRG